MYMTLRMTAASVRIKYIVSVEIRMEIRDEIKVKKARAAARTPNDYWLYN